MKPRVMIVDDDDAVRRTLASALARTGFEVSTANDGAPALRLAEVATPDIVVVDYNMPTSGIQVVRTLKQRHGSAIYVAVLSGEDDTLTRNVCREAGADAVLTKPVSLGELRRLLMAAAISLDTAPAA